MAIIGLDLGTTNSLAAWWKDGESGLILNALGKVLTPSVVGLGDDGQVIVGEAAKERLQTHSNLTAGCFKRYMGSNKIVKLGKLSFRPEELSALVLKSLKADAEMFLGEEVTDAVISVPAYFSDAQRKATRNAGTLAGLKVQRLINEPTAAAIAYGLHDSITESTFLVFDLGGGTFDVSILELFEGVMHVHASTGDNYLGGEDFVSRLVDHFVKYHKITVDKLKGSELAQLRYAAEICKQNLTKDSAATMQFTYKNNLLTLQITRSEFELLVSDLVKRLIQPVERALRDAKLGVKNIDALVLAGGATRMPLVRSVAAKMLGKLPVSHINPDEVVARGAAIMAGMVMRDSAFDEIVLTDVCPYTLGIAVNNPASLVEGGQLFHPIIERNSSVPVSRVDDFYTTVDSQSKMAIQVFQGEARLVADNIALGTFDIIVPPAKAGKERVDVRFTYDIDGILEVDAKVFSTGLQKNLVIQENPGVLSADEIAARFKKLAALKVHPRENMENTAVLARGGRLYEQALGETRAYIGSTLQEFERVLDLQNVKDIEAMRQQLVKTFDEIEQSPINI